MGRCTPPSGSQECNPRARIFTRNHADFGMDGKPARSQGELPPCPHDPR
jgi:hypothetical protein